jgi:integrase
MPKRAPSGTTGLIKRHYRTCRNRKHPSHCACQWRGCYRGHEVCLAAWAGVTIDPHKVDAARAVFSRLITAVDEKRFDRRGEKHSLGTSQRFDSFIDEWVTYYADKAGIDARGLTSNSLPSMLHVLKTETADGVCLGAMTLETLVASPLTIERWLDGLAAGRRVPNADGKTFRTVTWTNATWNRYYELLHSICARATKWKTHDVPRMARNPMHDIEKRVAISSTRPGRILEDVEDRLFAVVDQLNAPQHRPNGRAKLTPALADAIRRQVASGARQKDVCSNIITGKIWHPATYRPTTKGDEMRRRLIGAFDGGLRAGEMMRIQIQHIDFRRPRVVVLADGRRLEAYEIALPPALTKGGKTTGETEYVLAGTARFRDMLDARRVQLKNDPAAYVFGTEAGTYQREFRRQWHRLFRLAGLDYGRNKGLVWHTTRHEFISRVAENTGDPVLTQEIARHKDLETTQGYFHARHVRKLEAAVGLNRMNGR